MKTTAGYVDLQVNGHNGVDFSSPELTADAFIRAAEQLLAAGTAIFLPTLITGNMAFYQRNLPLIRQAVERAGLTREIPGFHLEGPFLSPEPGAVGCHNPDLVMAPDSALLDRLIELSEGTIRLMTVAADRPGITTLITHARRRGVAISLGHHLADVKQIRAAADAGASALTHLGNGLPNLIDRHHNPIWAGLAEDRLSAMIITDGHHLPPEVIVSMIRVKGVERTIVVSDASSMTGMPPGRYRTLGNDVILEADGKLHNPVRKCLVGSACTMKKCMEHLASLDILTDEELDLVGRRNPLELVGLR